MKNPKFLSRLVDDEHHFERPFFLFLTLVMVALYIMALISSPQLRSAWTIGMFTLLMAGHIILYWLSPRVFQNVRWLIPYLVLQLAVAFSLGMLCRVWSVVFGLYPGLIGLFISIPVRRVWRAVIMLSVLVVSALNFVLVTSLTNLLPWVLGTIPIVVFVSLYVLMYIRQAEARARALRLLKDLEAANDQLSEYASRVEDLTIAAERQRMARELHDTLSQGLAGLILQLEAVDAHLAGKRTEHARGILEQSMQKARETLAEARQAIDDLRRPQATDLAEAVRQEAEHFRSATGIPCEPDFDLPAELPEVVSEAAIRAVSESLTNVARHARAKSVCLWLAETDEGLAIEVRDDGIGFDPAAVEAGHYGLLGMRERVRLAGGSLEVESGPGKGTRINIRFPLEKVPMPEPVRILVADDHLIIRQGLRLILETEAGFELVGEAADGAEAVRLCAQLHPGVVLMDLRMPGMDGLTAIEHLHAEQPEIAVVILTTFNEDDLMMRGLRAGAKGYLLKDTDRATLFNTVRAAARGETLLKPEILARVLSQAGERRAPAASAADLSERELEVLQAVARGERSKEIAVRLGISERTVKAHLAGIYNKLGVDSRAAAIAVAAQKGLLTHE